MKEEQIRYHVFLLQPIPRQATGLFMPTPLRLQPTHTEEDAFQYEADAVAHLRTRSNPHGRYVILPVRQYVEPT